MPLLGQVTSDPGKPVAADHLSQAEAQHRTGLPECNPALARLHTACHRAVCRVLRGIGEGMRLGIGPRTSGRAEPAGRAIMAAIAIHCTADMGGTTGLATATGGITAITEVTARSR